MAGLKRLFVDADAFVAIQNEKDANHINASMISKKVFSLKPQLVTSDPAFGEAITVISQKANHIKAVNFAEGVLASSVEIIEVDPALRKEGLEIFKKQTSKNARFTDCINMAILKREGLKEIFSFDSDYKKNGILRIGIDKPINPTYID